MAQLGLDPAELDRYSKEWWWNFTNIQNLRLSIYGLKAIQTIRIPYYSIQLPEPLRNRTFIQMGRLLACPYYIKKLDLVYLLGEQESVLLKLHADNLQQYLDNLQL